MSSKGAPPSAGGVGEIEISGGAAFSASSRCACWAASVIFLKFSKNDPSLLKLFLRDGKSRATAAALAAAATFALVLLKIIIMRYTIYMGGQCSYQIPGCNSR